MLLQLGGGAILRTYHQMGLCWTKSPPLHAGVRPQRQSPHPIPPPPPQQSNRINPSTPMSNQIMGRKRNTHKRMTTHQPSTRQRKKSSKRSVECSFSLRLARTVDGGLLPALSSHASQPNRRTRRRKKWGCCASNFRLHVNTGRSCTHLSSKQHGPPNPQRCVVPL